MELENSPEEITRLNREQLEIAYRELNLRFNQLEMDNAFLWSLLVGVSRKLQLSSASIKAGVTSLLDFNIFWDNATQHEFLENIDSSIDQVTKLVMLMSLAFRFHANAIEMKAEQQTLQEILTLVQHQIEKEFPSVEFHLKFPSQEISVNIDYEYISLALVLLFEVLAESENRSFTILADIHEDQSHWRLDIDGIHRDAAVHLAASGEQHPSSVDHVEITTAESLLKLKVFRQILKVQGIRFEVAPEDSRISRLRLYLPAGADGIRP